MSHIHVRSKLSADDIYKRAAHVAHHYGFLPIEHAVKEVRKRRGTRNRSAYTPAARADLDPYTCELHTAAEMYLAENLSVLPQPVMFYHTNITDGGVAREAQTYRTGKNKPLRFNVQVVGTDHSIAEALVIKVALDILDELGVSAPCIRFNSIGDRDTVQRFFKELNWFFRRCISEFTPDEQMRIKNDPVDFYREMYRTRHPLVEYIPTSLELLTESSRKHLWEVLEYFERTHTEYEIDPTLVMPNYYTDTLFEIVENEEDSSELPNETVPASAGALVVRGGRYNELSRKFSRQSIPAAGIVIEYVQEKGAREMKPPTMRFRHPSVYLAHLGLDAKMRSLEVLEMLRRARVPTYQSLGNDTLEPQLEMAETLKIPYLMIVGYKEATEGTVIVRDMKVRAQETVPLEHLCPYIKALTAK